MSDAVTILGVRVDNVTMPEAIERIGDMVRTAGTQYVVTPNPEIILRAHHDASFREVLNSASLSIPDGTGLLLASRWMGAPLRQRVTGVDLTVELAREAADRGWSLGCWSPIPGVAKRTAIILREAFGGLAVQSFEMEPTTHVDILFVGLGAPHQERWMQRAVGQGIAHVMIGVGGALDMIVGDKPRAPWIVQRFGLEWLWRLSLEPRRWRRIVRATIVFPWVFLRHRHD